MLSSMHFHESATTHAMRYSRKRALKTDMEEKKLLYIVVYSSYFCFLCSQKVFSKLHSITVEPLLSHVEPDRFIVLPILSADMSLSQIYSISQT